ncbi:uncharacterized protein [Solanum lycopersicum]|uniref:uncharacterized protein n=1 Tax=Solanum lycopersicum TaxID=4081 RepID=UPI0002BCAEAD
MFFDGYACRDGAGAGVVLISLERLILQLSFVLAKTCSNNGAKYQDLTVGFEMTSHMKIPHLDVYGDSQLIINQLSGSYEVKKEYLFSYHQYATLLLQKFDQVFLNYVPREENRRANTLANLDTTMTLGENETTNVHVCNRTVSPGCIDLQVDESHHTYV